MSFRSPLVLLLALALVPAVWAAFAFAARRRAEALRLFLGNRAEAQGRATRSLARRRRARAVLLVGAVALVGVALAGPRVGTALRESRQESLDLLVALDVSDSMLADDVAPSRLERAKLEIERVVEARRGDRVGLVVFAGDAFLQCPLTTDRGALRLFLDAADPEQVAVQGTDFARALAVADLAFNAAAEGEGERPRALLVVSDGEDHEGGLDDAADALRQRGVSLLALGIGTDEGAPVPDVRRGVVRGARRDRRTGEAVVTRYQEGALQDLAGRGDVVRVGARPAAPAVNARLDALDRAVVAQDEFAASAERFQWPLALGLLLLLAERVVALRPAPGARDEDDPPPDAPPPTPFEEAPPVAAPTAAASGPALGLVAYAVLDVATRRDGASLALLAPALPLVAAGVLGAAVTARRFRRWGRSAFRRSGRASLVGLAGWLGLLVVGSARSLPDLAAIAFYYGPFAVLAADALWTWLRPRARAARVAVAGAALAVVVGGCGSPLDAIEAGAREGRTGVRLIEGGSYAEAEAAFARGLARPDLDRGVAAKLWQALGVARARQERYAGADSAFAEALGRADTPAQRARYAFDAGTAALLADDAVRADSLLRIALLLDPSSATARRNQEIARRRIRTPPERPEPSAFAERVKARADSLVTERQYRAALDVMEDGLTRDSSVAAYAEYVQRLGGVVEIDESVPETP